MAMSLDKELSQYGCENSDLFADALHDAHHALCPDWNSEQLMYHPEIAITFYNIVRCRLGCESLPSHTIMRRFSNIRKSPPSEE